MSRSRLVSCALVVGLLSGLAGESARAEMVNWVIDSSQSYIRLSLFHPLDQYHVRNQNLTAWSDAGGRRATVDGTIASDVVIGGGNSLSSVKFLGTAGTAVNDKSLRPNPAQFNPAVTNASNPFGTYSGTGTAQAAYGGAITSIATGGFSLGYFSVADVSYSLNSGLIPLGAPSAPLPAGSTSFGLDSPTYGLDGVSVLGQQPVPDKLTSVSLAATNGLMGTIDYLGGNTYQLTYQVFAETGPFDGDLPFQSILSGVIVATAVIVPEPSSLALGLLAVAGFCVAAMGQYRAGTR